MTPARTKELLPILIAYANGETIEYWTGKKWIYKDENSGWIDGTDRYRIKPEPKLVPFTFEDNLLFRDKWIKIKGCLPLTKITSFRYKGLDFFGPELITWKHAFDNYEFEDGSPFGKYINE